MIASRRWPSADRSVVEEAAAVGAAMRAARRSSRGRAAPMRRIERAFERRDAADAAHQSVPPPAYMSSVVADHAIDREAADSTRARPAAPSGGVRSGRSSASARARIARALRDHAPAPARRCRLVTTSGVPPTAVATTGKAGRHGLENRQRHAFADRAVHVHVDTRQPALERRRDVPRNVTGRQCRAPTRGDSSRARSGPSPMTTRVAGPAGHRWMRERRQQRAVVLDGVEARDGPNHYRLMATPSSRRDRGASRRPSAQGRHRCRCGRPPLRDPGNPSAPCGPCRFAETDTMRSATRASHGFTIRRFDDGGASLSLPCSVNTTRRPGRRRRASAP